MPGSHVIVKTNGEEPPIKTFEEAGSLAAYFSKGKGADKVEIDYTQKKNVKNQTEETRVCCILYQLSLGILHIEGTVRKPEIPYFLKGVMCNGSQNGHTHSHVIFNR